MAAITSAVRRAMPSSRAWHRSRRVVPAVMPSHSAPALRSQCGQARPDSAGTKASPRSIAGGSAKASSSARSVNRPSRPPTRPPRRRRRRRRRPRSTVSSPMRQAMVGSSPRSGARTISRPVTARAKAPVPKVILASPGRPAAMAVERGLLVDDGGGHAACRADAAERRRRSAGSPAGTRPAPRTAGTAPRPSCRWRDS